VGKMNYEDVASNRNKISYNSVKKFLEPYKCKVGDFDNAIVDTLGIWVPIEDANVSDVNDYIVNKQNWHVDTRNDHTNTVRVYVVVTNVKRVERGSKYKYTKPVHAGQRSHSSVPCGCSGWLVTLLALLFLVVCILFTIPPSKLGELLSLT